MTATPPAEGLAQPFDSTTFSDPYAAYARLRKEASVHRIALPDRSPVWLVMGEADVRDGLTDRRLSVNRAHSRIGYKGFSLPPALDANLLNLDGDDHLRLRRLVSKGFTAHRVENLRSRVLSTVNRLADSLAEQQVADLVTDFAEPLPITVIGDLFAVPECDRAPFSRWVSNMLAPAHPSHVGQAVNDIHDFLTDLVAARRAAPGTISSPRSSPLATTGIS